MKEQKQLLCLLIDGTGTLMDFSTQVLKDLGHPQGWWISTQQEQK